MRRLLSVWLARLGARDALVIALAYSAAGIIWLALGHHVVSPLFPETRALVTEVISAAVFVCVSGVVLAVGLRALLEVVEGSARLQSLMAEELRVLALDQQLLAHRLLLAEEETRRLVAKDLHDGPLQALTLSFMQLDASLRGAEEEGRPVDLERLRGAMSTIREASEDIRSVVRALHPPLLSELGLGPAIQRHCDEVARRTTRPIQFNGFTTLPDLPSALSIALFRIAQEAIANAVKHTPGAVTVTLVHVASDASGDTVYVEVVDDGPGFEADAAMRHTSGERPPERGLGLVSMRERAASVGAYLSVESGPAGTRIAVSAPLAAAPAPPE